MINKIRVEKNIHQYLYGNGKNLGLQPFERYASFDYCFNYFQSFNENAITEKLDGEGNMENSCLQLAFFLASWGMYRGSSFLLQKSAKTLAPIISLIATSDKKLWNIDANCYSNTNIEILLNFKNAIIKAFKPNFPSDILVTKIMLGVFGSIPALDTYFRKGFEINSFNFKSVKKIGDFYNENMELIEKYRMQTIPFNSGGDVLRCYSRAKVIDMIFFIEGMNL